MGDALIVRRGGSSSSIGKLKTVIITQNTTWTVPKAKDQMFSVKIFGGGGGGGVLASSGSYGGGGGGGMMNKNHSITSRRANIDYNS